MKHEEIDRLARLIAEELRRTAVPTQRGSWVPLPVRPEPPPRSHEPPVWSGAGQALGDLAPVRNPVASGYRDSDAERTKATRSAAAGRGARTAPKQAKKEPISGGKFGRRRLEGFRVPIGVSNRHVHLSGAHALQLFGPTGLVSERAISQPQQFAALQKVAVVSPSARLDGVRVVGPARGETQVELSVSDARRLGITPPISNSGQLASSLGGVVLEGTVGRVTLTTGVIIAARHLHLSAADGVKLGLSDGDVVSVRAGAGARAALLEGVLVRCGESHTTELHLDVDEANALSVQTGDAAVLMSRQAAVARKRPLITEHDVQKLARAGQPLPENALLTPSARDRARSLGLLPA